MKKLWRITPRDPLVLGDGRGGVPYVARQTWRLPIPSTTAGFVRAGFLAHLHRPSRADAEAVLRGVSVRGPWVIEETEEGDQRHHFFPPADVLVDDDGGPVQGRVARLGEGEGVSWPGGLPVLPGWVRLSERGPAAGASSRIVKRHPVEATVWPLERLATFALEMASKTGLEDPVFPLESRIHVSIEPRTQTADPGLLYATTGVRFPHGWHLALEVHTDPAALESLGSPEDDLPRFMVLGGESRPSMVTRLEGGLPALDDVRVEDTSLGDRLEAAAKGPNGLEAAGIRLQLLTHAVLAGTGGNADAGGPAAVSQPGSPGWIPRWLQAGDGTLRGRHPALDTDDTLGDVQLELTALCMPSGFIPISGWNLQAGSNGSMTGAPREVRRLVPAGTIYYFTARRGTETLQGRDLIPIYRALWMADLEPAPNDTISIDAMRAHPARDGFGLVLPGLWRWESSEGRN